MKSIGRKVVAMVSVALAIANIGSGQNLDSELAKMAPKWVEGVNRIIIKLKADPTGAVPQATRTAAGALHNQLGCLFVCELKLIGDTEVYEIPAGSSLKAAIKTYMDSGLVEYAEPDYRFEWHQTPNDPKYPDQWWLHNTGQTGGTADRDIDAPEAWATRTDAPNVVVAVLDSGIEATHPDLSANLWVNSGEIPGDSIDNDNNGYVDDIHGASMINGGVPVDDVSHGTAVAGVIGAVGNNSVGVSGVAWDVNIMAVKVGDANGIAASDIVEGLDYAVMNGAKILNISIGGPFSKALDDGLAALSGQDVIVVASSGNSYRNTDIEPGFPASHDYPHIVSVGAIDHDGLLANFSNAGKRTVDLFAPGVDIVTTDLTQNGSYTTISGTSFSAPTVCGILALMQEHAPARTTRELAYLVFSSVDTDTSYQNACATEGRANLDSALQAAGAATPVNDNFANASTMTRYRPVFGSNRGATAETGEPTHAGATGNSIWWSWQSPVSGLVSLSTAGSDFDTALAVYQGSSVNSLTLIAENDNSSITFDGTNTSRVIFQAVGGATYHFAVDGNEGAVRLNLAVVPGNDDQANAFPLSGPYFNWEGSNEAATREVGEAVHAGVATERSVWWRWRAPQNGTVTLSTTGSDFNTTLAVYEGSAVVGSNVNHTVANDINANFGSINSSLKFQAGADLVYDIVVAGTDGAAGRFRLHGGYVYSVTELQPLSGDTDIEALAINNNSDVVGSSISSSGVYRPIKAPALGAVTLITSATDGRAWDINDLGTTVINDGAGVSYYHTDLGGLVDLPGTPAIEVINRINDQDTMVGSSDNKAYKYTVGDSAVTLLNILSSGALGDARGINNNSQIVGWSTATTPPVDGLLWSGANPNPSAMGYLPGFDPFPDDPWDIGDGGYAVGLQHTPGGPRAYMWSGFQMFDLGSLMDRSTFPWRVNGERVVIGALITPIVDYCAFIWRENALIDLNEYYDPAAGNWFLAKGVGINDHGQLTGMGTLNGQNRAWVLSPPQVLTMSNPAESAGTFSADIYGTPWTFITVEKSDDLFQTWTTQTVALLGTGHLAYSDPTVGGINQRYYRLRDDNGRLSGNAVGFYRHSFPPGDSMFANQLIRQDNRAQTLFASSPLGSQIFDYNEETQGYQIAINTFLGWLGGDVTIEVGEGGFFRNPLATPYVHTFVGKVPANGLVGELRGQTWGIRSSFLPKSGVPNVDFGLPIEEGDVISTWDNVNAQFISHTMVNGAWSPSAPSVGIGEAFFLDTSATIRWQQPHSIW